MKRLLLCVGAGLGCRPPVVPATGERSVTILAMNDWHAAFGERETGDGARGGLPWFLAAIEARRAVDPELLLLDAGDGFQGDAMANARLGQATVEAFTQMGVDAAAIGNHEFDHGPCKAGICDDPHPLRGALRAAAARAPYPYLAANIVEEAGQPWRPPGVQASVLWERGGVKVGVLGLTTQDTPTTTRPEHVADLRFTDVVAAAEANAAELRADGAEVVVAVAHVSGDCRDAPADGPCVPDGELGRLLTELPRGTLDLIVAGHAHHRMQGRVGDTVFIETGAHGGALGEVDVRVTASGAVQVQVVPRPLWSLDHAPADPWCAEGVAYPRQARPVGGVQLAPAEAGIALGRSLQVWNGPGCAAVGCLQAAAPRFDPETQSSPLGALVSDALLAAHPGAQVAFQNAGGLRDDLAEGLVRLRDVDRVMPFRDGSHAVSLSGADLLRAIEVGASGAHGLLLPAGLSYTVTTGDGLARDLDGDGVASLWERDRVCAVTVGGAPLDREATYAVVVSDFLLGGGDHQAVGLGRGTGRAVSSEGRSPRVADSIGDHIAAAGAACREVDRHPRVVVTDCQP